MNTLARYFSALVTAHFDSDTLAEINRRNATPDYVCACATHDFTDANALMWGAWGALHFEAPDLSTADSAQAVADEMGRAWDAAKAAGFDISKLERT